MSRSKSSSVGIVIRHGTIWNARFDSPYICLKHGANRVTACSLCTSLLTYKWRTKRLSWNYFTNSLLRRSQRPRSLRRGAAVVPLLGLRVRIQSGHGCLSLMNVVCCRVEFSATGWSLVQSSPTESDVSECDREASKITAWSTTGFTATDKKNTFSYTYKMYKNWKKYIYSSH